MRQLGVSVLIGAALAGGYRATIGQALGGIGQIDQGLGGLQRRIMDVGQAWAGFTGLKHLVVGAGDQAHELEQIGVTADMGADKVASLRAGLVALSSIDQTNQSTNALIGAYKDMASAGLTDRIKDQGAMLTVMRAVGRTATAATADIGDMAKTAVVLVDTLGVAPDALANELDRLAFAGKKGSFELKDMARYFPQLGAAAKDAGLTGTQGVATLGAALQIARKGTGDASEAATNTANFFQKMMSKETIKNLKDHNVDVIKLMTEARQQGKNGMIVYLEELNKLLGDGSTAEGAVKRQAMLASLFADAQVQNFIRPALGNLDQLKAMIGEVTGASGTVATDYGRITTTFKEQSKGAASAIDNLGMAIGNSLLPPLGAVLVVATPIIGWITGMAESSPTATAAIAGLGAALTILPPALRLVAFGLRTIGVAVAANPIGLAAAVLIGAAALIYDHWAEVSAFFGHIWDYAKAHWRSFAMMFGPLGLAAIGVIDNWQTLKSFAEGMWDGATRALQAFGDFVGRIWAKIAEPIKAVAALAGISLDSVAQIGAAAPQGGRSGRSGTVAVAAAQAPQAAAPAPVQPGAAIAPSAPQGRSGQGGQTIAPAAVGAAVPPAEAQRGAAIPPATLAAAASAPNGKIDVNIKVDNLPRGAQVDAKSTGSAVGTVDTYAGYQMAMP